MFKFGNKKTHTFRDNGKSISADRIDIEINNRKSFCDSLSNPAFLLVFE
jgi:hypothetical protein